MRRIAVSAPAGLHLDPAAAFVLDLTKRWSTERMVVLTGQSATSLNRPRHGTLLETPKDKGFQNWGL